MLSLQACQNYEYPAVKAAVIQMLEPLGSIRAFVKPGMRVAVKPNLVLGKKPDQHATTHPAVIQAVCELIREAGGEPLIVESPGGPYNHAALKSVYSISGMTEASARSGAVLNYDTASREVHHPNGHTVKRLTIIQPILEADAVVNVCKLKTHGMTMYTGAVKNLFGVIPGTQKAEYHFRMPELSDFCHMLLDINTFVRPVLHIMDAITGMEGAGPTGGEPRQLGLLAADTDPFEMDLVMADLIGFQPDEVMTVRNAIERGLCPDNPSKAAVCGPPASAYRCQFQRPPSDVHVDFLNRYPAWVQACVKRLVRPKPVFVHSRCVGCGECMRCCPAKTIQMVDQRPVVHLKNCIRCFCCQELCKYRAVEIKRPVIMRLANKI